jgi:hypothetical protein
MPSFPYIVRIKREKREDHSRKVENRLMDTATFAKWLREVDGLAVTGPDIKRAIRQGAIPDTESIGKTGLGRWRYAQARAGALLLWACETKWKASEISRVREVLAPILESGGNLYAQFGHWHRRKNKKLYQDGLDWLLVTLKVALGLQPSNPAAIACYIPDDSQSAKFEYACTASREIGADGELHIEAEKDGIHWMPSLQWAENRAREIKETVK